MAQVEVILKENFPQLGWVGDRVRVRRGFARNWLIPKNIAVEASARNRKQLEHHVAAINAKKVRIQSEAEELRTRLENCSLHFKLKVGKGGKAFGSISARDIQAELAKQGFELDRRQIKLGEPIREARYREVQPALAWMESG